MFDADKVDYSEPVALFPLPSVSLFPHALQPLHVFEPRYRQMVEDAMGSATVEGLTEETLEECAPIAMATFSGEEWRDSYGGVPPLRSVVCVGRIVQHRNREDGRHDIVLHGVARARIVALHEPEGRRLYRMAELAPLERSESLQRPMNGIRTAMNQLLSRPRIGRVETAKLVRDWFARSDVPTHAALEVAGYAMVRDNEARYQLLAEADVFRRAQMVRNALVQLETLIALAERQRSEEWPKGESWN